ncbi:phage Gp37/Gp68 family protein [Saccharomonospora piscinae]|uniref:DUF5131 family protein n=1 Tax=Saccharomonospora piscinae TaxID=687388 RepID=UPI001106E3AF|nr:phage Gp37/Gp68 family protein [Saccharomonospora piscinae]TLW89217.1 phage Gp37/Gp68 family protein [Saccharomonospora piscinae]
MSDGTSIEWTNTTWNPVTGCDNCYALTLAERFRGTPGHYFQHGFDVQLRPNKLTAPLGWRKPRRVFVNSMSDLFHTEVPDDYIARVFAVIAATPQHTYQLLTKRHARMRALLNSPVFRDLVAVYRDEYVGNTAITPGWDWWPLRNVWLGVSVEDQKRADLRIPALLDTPAAVRFLSCEPLLGPVDLDGLSIDWVIAGGESGRDARPMHPDWVRTLRDQCAAAGVPFFFKQWGAWTPAGRGIGMAQHNVGREVLVGPPLDDMGHRQVMRRVGKGKAGRELDGRTWDEFPQLLAEAGVAGG